MIRHLPAWHSVRHEQQVDVDQASATALQLKACLQHGWIIHMLLVSRATFNMCSNLLST